MPVQMDLIDVNDATGEFLPPSAGELKTFRDALTAAMGMPIVRRYSGGQDIQGGCGMLAGRRQPSRISPSPLVGEGRGGG